MNRKLSAVPDAGADDVFAAVRAADPVSRTPLADPGVRLALDELFASVTGDETAKLPAAIDSSALERRRARRRRLAVGIATTVSLAVGGGVAAAGYHSAHTGQRATDPRIDDHSEWLDTSGDDFPAIARQLASGLPFAPGDGPDTYIGVSLPTSGEVTTAGVRNWFALDALCGWEGYWMQERAAGDGDAVTSAEHAIHELIGSGDVIAVGDDPVTVAAFQHIDAAVAAGDEAPVAQDWSANCDSLPQPWAH